MSSLVGQSSAGEAGMSSGAERGTEDVWYRARIVDRSTTSDAFFLPMACNGHSHTLRVWPDAKFKFTSQFGE